MALDGTAMGLLASVADWTHRPDLTAQIPDFVTLAETQINRRLRVRPMIAQTVTSLSAEYIELPADFVGERTLVLTSAMPKVDLEFITQDQMDQRVNQWSAPARPRFAAIVGNQVRLGPIPDQAYTAELTYFQALPPLASNSTNWLLTKQPDAYLYGALTQAAPYMIDDDRVGMWAQMFTTVLADIQNSLAERTGALLTSDVSRLRRHRSSFNITTG